MTHKLTPPTQILSFPSQIEWRCTLMFEFSLRIPSFELQQKCCFEEKDFDFDSVKNLKIEEEKDYKLSLRLPDKDRKRRRY